MKNKIITDLLATINHTNPDEVSFVKDDTINCYDCTAVWLKPFKAVEITIKREFGEYVVKNWDTFL